MGVDVDYNGSASGDEKGNYWQLINRPLDDGLTLIGI